MADLGSTRVFGKLTVMHDAIVKANAEIAGRVSLSNSGYDEHLIIKRSGYSWSITPTTGNGGMLRFITNTGNGFDFTGGIIRGDGSGLTGTASLRATGTTKGDVGLGNLPNSTTASRTSSATNALLQAKAMNDHRTSGDHDGRYVQLTDQNVSIEYEGSGLKVRTLDNNGSFIFQARSSGQAPRFTVAHGAPELNGGSAGWKIGGNRIYDEGYKPTKSDVGLGNLPNSTTRSRDDAATARLLQARGMYDHKRSGDHDGRYARLYGAHTADFDRMPRVGGDPIVESGSNANGEYTKFADGTMICSQTDISPSTSHSNSTSVTGVRYGDTLVWSYPTAFSSSPSVNGTSRRSTNDTRKGWVHLLTVGTDSASMVNVSTDATELIYRIQVIAIGRWF